MLLHNTLCVIPAQVGLKIIKSYLSIGLDRISHHEEDTQ